MNNTGEAPVLLQLFRIVTIALGYQSIASGRFQHVFRVGAGTGFIGHRSDRPAAALPVCEAQRTGTERGNHQPFPSDVHHHLHAAARTGVCRRPGCAASRRRL